MVMPSDFAVESRGRAGVMDASHDAHRDQPVQNPINRRPRDVRNPLLYGRQDLIGRGAVIQT